jgi:hypothetical protein
MGCAPGSYRSKCDSRKSDAGSRCGATKQRIGGDGAGAAHGHRGTAIPGKCTPISARQLAAAPPPRTEDSGRPAQHAPGRQFCAR